LYNVRVLEKKVTGGLCVTMHWTCSDVRYRCTNILRVNLMCFGSCIVIIDEEENRLDPTQYFYWTCNRLNMFRAPLCPSSRALDYTADYHVSHLTPWLPMVGRSGARLCRATGPSPDT
jgi:hypothetical protein